MNTLIEQINDAVRAEYKKRPWEKYEKKVSGKKRYK